MILMEKKEIIRNITLMLVYLNGWLEDKRNVSGEKVFRAWTSYNFDVLNELEEKKLIYQIPGGRSLILKEPGLEAAGVLKEKHLGYIVDQPLPQPWHPPGMYRTKKKHVEKKWSGTQLPILAMTETEKEELKKELALLLMYITAKEEDKRNAPGEKEFRAWKRYDPECIAEMKEEQLFAPLKRWKDVFFTAKGIMGAQGLLESYLKTVPR